MKRLSDNELIDELKRRFEENEKALFDLRKLTEKLTAVNKKLQESEALKSNFLSNVRNEINNPLTSIMGLSKQIFSSSSHNKDTAMSMARMIYSEAFDLDFQLRNILAAAEIEAGETELHVSLVDVCKIIQNTVDSYSHKITEKKLSANISFNCLSGSDKELFFKTDAEKLRLIVSNLLSNAIEYSFEGSQIEVDTHVHERNLYIYVKDSGAGIDTEDKEKIFDRFRQLEVGTTRCHRGHGLGLSITKDLVELLKGTISVSSTKGKGCGFTVVVAESESDDEIDIYSDDGNEFIFEEEL